MPWFAVVVAPYIGNELTEMLLIQTETEFLELNSVQVGEEQERLGVGLRVFRFRNALAFAPVYELHNCETGRYNFAHKLKGNLAATS